jgi:hypothetical protein
MSELQDKLKRDRARFNRKVRRFAIAVSAAVVMIGGVLVYLFLWPTGAGQQRDTSRITPEQDLSQPTVVPTADPDDPSQLVMPEYLMSEGHVTPLEDTSVGKRTMVDFAMLATMLEAVKEVPQEELEARVDPAIEWKHFNDPQLREKARGRICQFRGTLRRFTETKGVDMSEAGIDNLYEGQIQDVYGRWFSFYCFQEPPREIKRTDVAVLTGVFYKLISYSTRGGEDLISPLIVARTVTPRRGYQGPVAPGRGVPEWLIYAGLAVGSIAACVALHYIMKRRPTRYERHRG